MSSLFVTSTDVKYLSLSRKLHILQTTKTVIKIARMHITTVLCVDTYMYILAFSQLCSNIFLGSISRKSLACYNGEPGGDL